MPEPSGVVRRTAEADALTALVLPAFELNGEFVAAAEQITADTELTPALWQVLGAVLDEPLPVAEIARRVGLGLARQSVQRVANLLVEQGLASWHENPAHLRAKLMTPTTEGRRAVRLLAHRQHAWAQAVGAELGLADLEQAHALVRRMIDASRRVREQDMRA